MARGLRVEHYAAVARTGMDLHRELRARFDASYFRRAALVNGRLAALWGVQGSAAAAWGVVWLALTDEAVRYPMTIVREARRQLDEVMTVKRELATTIIGGDEAAKRFAIFLGFHVDHDGPGAQAWSRFGRKDLSRHLDTAAELRLPIGQGYAIAMGYHQDTT